MCGSLFNVQALWQGKFAYFGILMRFVRGRTTLIWLYIRQIHVCLLNFEMLLAPCKCTHTHTQMEEAVNKRHLNVKHIWIAAASAHLFLSLVCALFAKWMMKGRLIGLLVQHFDCFRCLSVLHAAISILDGPQNTTTERVESCVGNVKKE